jgi:hypothetical protein
MIFFLILIVDQVVNAMPFHIYHGSAKAFGKSNTNNSSSNMQSNSVRGVNVESLDDEMRNNKNNNKRRNSTSPNQKLKRISPNNSPSSLSDSQNKKPRYDQLLNNNNTSIIQQQKQFNENYNNQLQQLYGNPPYQSSVTLPLRHYSQQPSFIQGKEISM